MAKITYTDKVKIKDIPVAEINKFTDANANEIKAVVNGLDDSVTLNASEIAILKNYSSQGPNELIEKGFNHDVNFDWFVFAQVYRFNGIITENLVTDTITLDPAPTTLNFRRFDVIVFNDNFTFSVVKGTEGLSAAIPKIDIKTQIQLTVILVEYGTTEPSYLTKQLMYDEGIGLPAEFAATKTGASITIGSTEQSSSGTKSIKVANPANADVLFLDKNATFSSLDVDTITFKVKNLTAGNWRFYLYSYNSIGAFYQGTVMIRDGRYGYSSSNITDWQTIIVPMYDLFGGAEVLNTGFAITFFNNTGLTLYFDEFALNGNFTQGPISYGVSEAPFDDKYYLRRNAAWTDLQSITLTPATTTNKIVTEADVASFGGGDMLLAAAQSVTGKKTFDNTKLAVKGSSTGSTTIETANASATDYAATLPAKTGTVAMTDDIVTDFPDLTNKLDDYAWAMSDLTTALVAGDTSPVYATFAFTLNGFFVSVGTAPTGASIVINLKKNGTTVLSTQAIIDATEFTSLTGTNPVVSVPGFIKGDKITAEIVQVGSTIAGLDLKIYLDITRI